MKKVSYTTASEGQAIAIDYRVANVKHPVCSAGTVTSKGYWIALGPSGGFITTHPLEAKNDSIKVDKFNGVYWLNLDRQGNGHKQMCEMIDDVPGAVAPRANAGPEGEAARPVQLRKSPLTPSSAEWDQHQATHCPFRSWCPSCVAGRLQEDPHYKKPDVEDGPPRVYMDFAFLSEGSSKAGSAATVLVILDRRSNATRAAMVPGKGVDEFMVSCVCTALDDWGHHEVILRGDNEPAMSLLIDRVQEFRKGKRTVVESRVAKDAKSGGAIENANKRVVGMSRTLRSRFCERTGLAVSVTSPLLPWIVRHGSWLLERYQVSEG